MKKAPLLLLAFILFSSHDMFLKLDGYLLPPDTPIVLQLFNGTFDKSDNTIDRNRMIDVSLVGNGKRTVIDSSQWYEKDSTTFLNLNTGEPGTYVVGVSTRPRNIEMAAEDFNNYLEHDGVVDMLAQRKKKNTLTDNAVEKYSKHVKTIFQVGDKRTADWQTPLGYPIEFIPLQNPYETHVGHDLKFQLLVDGKPLSNQLVYIGSDSHSHDHDHDHEHSADGHSHGHDHDHDADEHTHQATQQARTDADGQFKVDLTNEGIWYVRTIHLVESDEEGLTHESNWATITFEVADGDHSHADGSHTHEHEHSHGHDHEHTSGIPSSMYWLGSAVLVIGLFFWFNRNK